MAILGGQEAIKIRNCVLHVNQGNGMKRKNAEISLAGKPFGQLVVVSKWGKGKWICLCDCGEYVVVIKCNLINGDTQSCGCFRRELRTTHGQAKYGKTTTTYKIWQWMKDRCGNKNNQRYEDYGGRGIKVCQRWLKSENFYEDMGKRPKRLSIERVDNSKGYYKENCRWATRTEQARNTRSNRLLEYNGQIKCLAEWAEKLEINRGTLLSRLKKYPPQIAFNLKPYERI